MTRVLAIFVLCTSLCGCETKADRHANYAVVDYYFGNYEQARRLLDPLAKHPDENFVLNNARLGSTTLAEYRLDDAQTAFLRAYEVINSVGVNDGGRSLGAVAVSENIRIWKGEPFERAMVNFYLGLIYYMQHDYGNARAAFENAMFKLTDYRKKNQQGEYLDKIDSDFALGYLMLAKSWQRLGDVDKAQMMFDQVKRLRPDLAELADANYNDSANLLVVADWGTGPQKWPEADGSIAGFTPTPVEAGPMRLPRVIVDGQEYPSRRFASAPVDLLALAQDRKWQSIDTMRVLKSGAGTGLMAAGAAVMLSDNQPQAAEVGAALILSGLFLKVTSQPDIRFWELLPRATFVIPLHVTPGPHDVTISFGEHERQTWRGLVAPQSGDNTYYMRIGMYTQGPYVWPPPAEGFNPIDQFNSGDPR